MYIYRLHLPSASRKLLHFSKFVKNCWFLFWHRQKEICIKYALLPLPEFLGTECRWQHRMLWILYDSFPGNLVQDKSERIWRLMAVAPWPGSLVMVQPGDYCPLPHTGVGAAQVFTQLHQPSLHHTTAPSCPMTLHSYQFDDQDPATINLGLAVWVQVSTAATLGQGWHFLMQWQSTKLTPILSTQL